MKKTFWININTTQWGGFYVAIRPSFRVCLGYIAITLSSYDVEEILLERYTEKRLAAEDAFDDRRV
jgi:hypothetical protein